MTIVLSDDLLMILLHLYFLHHLLMLKIWLYLFLNFLFLLIWIIIFRHHFSELVYRSLVRLARVLRDIFYGLEGTKHNLWRMALRYDVERLLYVLKDDFAAFFKTCDLNLNDFANRFSILFNIFNTFIILNNTRNA
jgi:hypothetical protein